MEPVQAAFMSEGSPLWSQPAADGKYLGQNYICMKHVQTLSSMFISQALESSSLFHGVSVALCRERWWICRVDGDPCHSPQGLKPSELDILGNSWTQTPWSLNGSLLLPHVA